jgi:hypothetical protein
MNFDIDLMAQTSERITESLSQQMKSLADTHGVDFSMSVMGNVGCYLLTCLIASEDDETARVLKLLLLVKVLSLNVKAEVAGMKTEELIEKIKKGSKC